MATKVMEKAIYFDMDGTFVNLYGVENWLEMLINEDVTPYANAKPLVRLSTFAFLLNKLHKKGWHIGIVSWLSKNGSEEYNNAVTNAKVEWLAKHIPSVKWDEIKIVKYGTPKSSVVNFKNSVLIDDEENNRNEWEGVAFDETKIFDILKVFRTAVAQVALFMG